MKIPRWVSVVALLSSTALLFGCGMAGSASSTKTGGLAVTTAALPDATVNLSYSGTLQAAGGTTPYSWTVTSGALPTGLSLSSSGQISGTPTTMGSYDFQVQVTDASKKSSSGNIGMKVSGPPPSIYVISPSSGSTNGGTPVTISGKNLQSGATVTFGGLDGTSVTVVNSSEMTAVTPPHAAGSVDVTITNPGGRSATLAAGFGYGSAAPSLSAVSPNSGPTSGGTTVKITGSNFVAGALVFFGSVAATGVSVNSATQIQAVSPSVTTAAAVDVVVKNSDGQSGSLSNAFTYTDSPSSSSPTVTDVSPNSTTTGSNVNVDGTNFASGATVNVGSTPASNVKFMSSTQLNMTVPSVSVGTYDVTVTNSNGLSATLSSGLTVADPTSLLSGCTVNSSNQPVCGSNVGSATVPSGWTLADAEGFDAKALANSSEELHGISIECSLGHTGSCAVLGTITTDGYSGRWILNSPALQNSQEFYVSWWEYVDSVARLNTEMFLAAFNAGSTFGSPQSFVMDYYAQGDCKGVAPGGYNCTNGEYTGVANSGSGGLNNAWYGPWQDLNMGSWRQYELHYRANTPGSTDGVMELYVDGQMEQSLSGNLNDGNAMTNATLWIGGTYSAIAWVDNATSPTVCNKAGTGQARMCTPFANCSPCPIPPDFNRYWDDIIVLKK